MNGRSLRHALAFFVAVVLVTGGFVPRPVGQEAASVALPATPVGNELAWLLGVLNHENTVTEAELASHFSPAVLAAWPPPTLKALVEQFAGAGPFTFAGLAREPTRTRLVGLLTGGDGSTYLVAVATEPTPPYRMTGVAPLPAAQAWTHPAMASESLGGLFDIGGRKLFLSCSGDGEPTVMLEAGSGDSGGLWSIVQNGLAPETRVCLYDRANVSASGSDPVPGPRTAKDLVDDLHYLLQAAELSPPYILAGHSFGGLIVRLYAQTFPDEVAGMVLVDAVHEDEQEQRKALVPVEQWQAAHQDFPPISLFEQVDQAASLAQIRTAQIATPLQPMPLFVLSAGHSSIPSLPADWPLGADERLHQELQAELATLVPEGKFALVEDSGHYIQLEQPERVIATLRELVGSIRSSSEKP